MSRWHAPSCSNPRVVVQQQQPHCESCDSRPDIDTLVAAEAFKTSPIPFLPPDEPPGQMHLWWPPCVPYVTKGPDGHPVPVQPPDSDVPTSTPDDGKPLGESDRLHVYPQRLKENEFRVMCLYPVEDVNAPIHITLEVYDDLRYHEYETVSYTWGGENGDSRLSQPVYVGPYWDILLQTRNCWEMLRHMRPWKGMRTIWVDAICINQTDMQERQGQVAKMGGIYEKANRLVMYLGSDLVPPTSKSSPYPRRHHLNELDTLTEKPLLPSALLSSSKQFNLSDVLGREYFRRLWIIQELIMSKNITLRIGDIEFIVDQAVSSKAVQACDIPWFVFITRKAIDDCSGNNLRAAVEFVDASRASDPRDKVFGVLGLVDLGEHHIAPEYSISFRHLVIGYYAYFLLVIKDPCVLIKASGLRAPEGLPSWAPPTQDDASRNRHLIPSTRNRQFDWLWSLEDFTKAFSRDHSKNYRGDFQGNGLEKFDCSTKSKNRTCLRVPRGWHHRHPRYAGEAEFDSDWHATIDTSTGKLNLTAIHIMSFHDIAFSKAEIERNGEVYIHTLRAGRGTLHLYANECIFDPAEKTGKVHLFSVCDESVKAQYGGTLSTLCLLRQINDEDEFRLVSASVVVCFHVPFKLERDFDPFSYTGHLALFSYERYRFALNVFSAYDDKTLATLPLPLLRPDRPAGTSFDREMEKLIVYGFEERHSRYESIFEHDLIYTRNLNMSLNRPLVGPRQKWGLNGNPDRYKYFFDVRAPCYIRFPSPRLAFPMVRDSRIILQVFQSILDAERSGSSAGFFNVYLQAIRGFNPELIRWKTRPKDAADYSGHGEVRYIDLVQLRFEPCQFDVLEEILDSIQEDLKRGISVLQAKTPPANKRHKEYSPPFLRIGWHSLALNQANEATESLSLKEEDAYGFNALEAINEAIDKENLKKHESAGDELYQQASDDEIVDDNLDLRNSLSQRSKKWVF
ncbi:Heterokaryon incompatibility protein 6, OR allele [Colletotrichum tropicale]|nr:Heterokaryon incompatibility protein 6, OR allele [Colletotrichum tropicale]